MNPIHGFIIHRGSKLNIISIPSHITCYNDECKIFGFLQNHPHILAEWVFLFQFLQAGILIMLKKQEQIGDSIINLSSLVGHSYNIWIYVSIFDFLASKRISNSILNDMNYIERTFSHSRHLSRYTFRRIYHRLLTLHPIWHHLC